MAVKIMFLADYYEGPQAGTERQLLQLLEHCDRSRYDPAITFFRNSEYVEHNRLFCPVNILDIKRLGSWRSIFKIFCFSFRLRRDGYRLVHCFFNDVSLITPPLLRLVGLRVLVSRRDMGLWYTRANLAVLRLVSAFVDCYVANCRAVADVVQRREWVPRRRIAVVYNGITVAKPRRGGALRPLQLPGVLEEERVIGIVANLKPIKRIDVLIRAVAGVTGRFPAVRLVVVGKDGLSKRGQSMRKELQSLASCLRIADTVVFAGAVEDPMPYIDRFTVAVLCSESEGFSNSLMEYMQAGRPIVCSDTGGNPELIQDGVNGFLVPVGDVDALADRLIKLLLDGRLAARLGDAARERAHLYSITRMVSEQMASYDEVLSPRRCRERLKRVSDVA